MAESEDVEGEGLDSDARGSSGLDLHSSRMGSCLTMKALYVMISSRIFLPSAEVLCRNEPPWASSRQ